MRMLSMVLLSLAPCRAPEEHEASILGQAIVARRFGPGKGEIPVGRGILEAIYSKRKAGS